ncbi:hypothetical protein [Nocardia nova]|jgi:predicted ATPase|uniref:hypothetical protein n=1 Tax=Nocardia nova TaxID=37330 RepID=UPI0025AFB182|nr:hypothetical protein [Nocardia nova]
MREALVEFLRARRALLVLDNGEQVVDALADLVETLLLACADLRVLVTTLFAGGFEMDAVERVCTAAAGGGESARRVVVAGGQVDRDPGGARGRCPVPDVRDRARLRA